jgi:hypothetical protein
VELDNRTPWSAQVFTGGVAAGAVPLSAIIKARQGLPSGVSVRGLLVVKATLQFEKGQWQPAAEQLPIWELDEEGPPFFEKDIMFQKGGVDLVVLGSARAPADPVTHMEVSVRLGDWSRILAVFGDRIWARQWNRFVASAPKPFKEMPIIWENAYGGTTLDHEGTAAPSPFNAVGKGYTLPNPKSQVEGVALPNIEDPGHLIVSIDDRPDPVGFGFLPFTNGLRLRAGLKPHPSGLPEILPRVHNAAHPDLVLPGYPAGSKIEVSGMTAPTPWRATLPAFPARAALRGPTDETALPLEPDTVCLMVDQQRLYVTAKGRFDYDLANPPDLTAVVHPS